MSDQLECEIGNAGPGEALVVSVRGEVDLSTAPDLESCVRGSLDGAGTSVVLDLAGLSFIDSSGLRVLVSLSNDARSNGASLVLRNVPRQAQRVMDITGLSEWFDIASD